MHRFQKKRVAKGDQKVPIWFPLVAHLGNPAAPVSQGLLGVAPWPVPPAGGAPALRRSRHLTLAQQCVDLALVAVLPEELHQRDFENVPLGDVLLLAEVPDHLVQPVAHVHRLRDEAPRDGVAGQDASI